MLRCFFTCQQSVPCKRTSFKILRKHFVKICINREVDETRAVKKLKKNPNGELDFDDSVSVFMNNCLTYDEHLRQITN